MSEHLISVAMCTYNGEKFIEQQLKSILNQSRPVDEIVICDDGSEDCTVKIAKQVLETEKINYQIIVNQNNLGFRKNFEKAIGLTKGDIIFLSDQDDVWRVDKVQMILRAFARNEKCLMVFSDAELVDEKLNILPGSLWDSVDFNAHKKKYPDWWELFLKGYYVTGATAAIKRELYKKSCPFSDNWYHDGWLAVHAVIYGEIDCVQEKLVKYRQHSHNQVGAEYSLKQKLLKKKEILQSNKVEQLNLHKMYYIRLGELYRRDRTVLLPEMREKLKNGIRVHKALLQLPQLNKMKRLELVFNLFSRKQYDRYYKKARGCILGDIVFLVL